ncbi:MAG: hypothetical protein WA994_03260, partial [Ornithinimicrobium sp.]
MSIEAPGGRGAERQVSTTVATATGSPASHHARSSGSTSRTADHLQHLSEGRERVPGHEVIDVWQHR